MGAERRATHILGSAWVVSAGAFALSLVTFGIAGSWERVTTDSSSRGSPRSLILVVTGTATLAFAFVAILIVMAIAVLKWRERRGDLHGGSHPATHMGPRHERFTKDIDGTGWDLWVQPRGSYHSLRVGNDLIYKPFGWLLHHLIYRDQYLVCVARRGKVVRPFRRFRFGPWTEDEAEAAVDRARSQLRQGQWDRRSPAQRPVRFWQRI